MSDYTCDCCGVADGAVRHDPASGVNLHDADMCPRTPTREMPPEEHAALSRPTLPAVDGPVHAVEALGRRCEELEGALRWALKERPCRNHPNTCSWINADRRQHPDEPCDDEPVCRAAWALLGRTT